MLEKLKTALAPLTSRTALVVAGLCAVVAATAGPFGTYDAYPFLLRLLYWSLVTSSSVLLGTLCHSFAQSRLGADRPVLVDGTVTVLMTVLFTPLLWLLTHWLLVNPDDAGPTLARLASYVATITMALCILRRVFAGMGRTLSRDGVEASPAARPRLMRRLPPEFQGPILHLTVRNHFVDVISAGSVETIRMRFGDAVSEMEPVVGYCTHRSHWVARAAIDRVERKGGKVRLWLVNGDVIPVSRTHVDCLVAAGVIRKTPPGT